MRKKVFLASLFIAFIFLLSASLLFARPAVETTIKVSGIVTSDKCTPCHLNFDAFKNPNLIFKHSYHILVRCQSCHFTWPHLPGKTIKPPMEVCFNCHGLYHGPKGIIAKSACPVCHVKPGVPKTHTPKWKKKDHKSANPRFCVTCHTASFCEDCHARENIPPLPPESYRFPGFLPEPSLYVEINPLKMGPKNGCYACHADRKALKLAKAGGKAFIDKEAMRASPHGDLYCVSCHYDFQYEPPEKIYPYKYVAGLSCKNCHDEKKKIDHRKEYEVYRKSVHGRKLLEEGNFDAPTCASCHGGHDIKDLRKKKERAEFHLKGYDVCGKCHKDYWDSYDDWYHGRAYKRKAPDAPACWDCHGAHDVFPKTEAASKVTEKNLPKTCGKCHFGSSSEFADYGSVVIHARKDLWRNNFLYKLEKSLLEKIGRLFGRK
jgi:ribosomal protein L31